jgi:RES domain-containing protein
MDRERITLYRLAKAEYANLSGAGAALYPGRWNKAGVEAIYTSTEAGVPVLERLVHTPKDQIPSNLAMMKIRLFGRWYHDVSPEPLLGAGLGLIDPSRNVRMLVFSKIKDATRFAHSFAQADIIAMAVPSVVVPVWNVVLYPQAPGFWHCVSLESVEPFEFDPRLFPEGTPVEASR